MGGVVLHGDIHNGATGAVQIGNRQIVLRVKDVAFLERAAKNTIMLSVLRLPDLPADELLVGRTFFSFPVEVSEGCFQPAREAPKARDMPAGGATPRV
jgi:hypothetical protein